jgi:hypothetical protein
MIQQRAVARKRAELLRSVLAREKPGQGKKALAISACQDHSPSRMTGINRVQSIEFALTLRGVGELLPHSG